MININIGGHKVSFSFLSINLNIIINCFSKNDKEEKTNTDQPENQGSIKTKTFKTLFSRPDIPRIKELKDDLIAYFLIQKCKEHSSWNLVMPVIVEKSSGVKYQFNNAYFSLEGLGGGLRNTSDIIFYLKRHREKGFNVVMSALIVSNEKLHDFDYIESEVSLKQLVENSTELHHYQENEFKYINKKYEELIKAA